MTSSARLRRAAGGRDTIRLALALSVLVLLAVVLILLADADPLQALIGLFEGAFGDGYALAETTVRAVPIAIVALGVAPALRAGIFPVGAEGQLAIGAVTATAAVFAVKGAPPVVALLVGCLAGTLGGVIWALGPAILRARFRVNEILSTLLMNYLASNLVLWSLRTWLGTSEDVATPRSDRLPPEALIPKLIDGTRLHWGLVAAVIGAGLLAYWVRSVRGLGFDIFASRRDLAARMGVREGSAVIGTMLVSGAAAGIAGWIQVAGLQGTLYPSVAGGLGFTGVLVALLGGLGPLGIVVASVVLAALATGSDGLQTDTGIPASIASVAQGLLLLGAALVFRGATAARPSDAAARSGTGTVVNAGDLGFWALLLAGAVRLATPVVLAALGETLVERSGIVNLGVEGMMALGAFAGIFAASEAGWGAGLILGAVTGGILGLAMGVAVLRGGANQIVVGIAMALLGTGLADYVFQIWQPSGRDAVIVPLVPTIAVPVLDTIPLIGQALFAQSPLTYFAVFAVFVARWGLRHTMPGIVLRAVGDDPEAASLRGVNVAAVRVAALAIGGALAGLGGATMTIGYLGSFTDDVTSGRGYVAIAVVIIGRWSPVGAMLGAVLFAFFDSLALLAQSGSAGLPVEFYSALPYATTLLALIVTARAQYAPRALGRGFES